MQTTGTETETERLGQMVILPASHTGSPRYMYRHYLDALAICREFRKFDLFITITCNPKWDIIKQNIFSGQQPNYRPDIVNRIFNEVVRVLIEDIKNGCFGPLKARLHTIEGQLRCLKHAHILLLLADSIGLNDIDKVIQAQLPDKDLEPDLFEAVCNFMLHGPVEQLSLIPHV